MILEVMNGFSNLFLFEKKYCHLESFTVTNLNFYNHHNFSQQHLFLKQNFNNVNINIFYLNTKPCFPLKAAFRNKS